MKKRIPVLRIGLRLRSKRSKTLYEVKNIKGNSVGLMSENGIEYILIPVNHITPDEYEPVYD